MSEKIALLGITFLISGSLGAQTSSSLTLSEADSLFDAHNLELLSAKCGISIADAHTAQAKLWSNPVVSIDENVYNKFSGRYFDFGGKSEQVVGIDQLIYIAGQHANVVRLQRLKGEAARLGFEELLRRLHGQMRQTFIRLYFAQRNKKMFSSEIVSLSKVLSALTVQEEKGNISRIETARIRALLLSLRQEQDQYAADETQQESLLRTYLSLEPSAAVEATLDEGGLERIEASAPDMKRIEEYVSGRADVRQANENVAVADAQINAERSKAYPEVHLRGQYDRNGGYFPDYFSVGVSVSLPLFNRNQGSIKAAKAEAEQSRYDYQDAVNKARNELMTAYGNFTRTTSLLATVSKDFDKAGTDMLFEGVNDNYRKRNISLLEFVDFYRTYKDAMLQMSSIKENAYLAAEALNTEAGHRVIEY